MSLGLVVLEEKLFTRTCVWTPTPQSDDIKNCLLTLIFTKNSSCPIKYLPIKLELDSGGSFKSYKDKVVHRQKDKTQLIKITLFQ